ncbi:hypothetical protein [Rhizobium phaseoli]|uniref:Uncharacterized protein n=1 Tax=Rhizobium phaseoli TaxID=396 RepID=A0ABN4QNG6_9HYPH|nr:hypothetical protein [Rhizobium phaseoli]ANL87067.1 hypothetical protein AMC81_PA00044 [Rhizobium phaseoli]ANL93576.1 hypothetical protein AMC80_PA00044 [Rhizobium phaseoli]
MTEHQRNVIAASEVPAIDATPADQVQPEAAPVEYPDGINPRWDVAQIATRGHILVGRLEYIFDKVKLPSIWLWFLLLVLTWLMLNGKIEAFGPRLMRLDSAGTFQRMLTYDPSTYFDIGGGVHAGPDLAWLGHYAPTPESLSVADHEALIAAVVADSAQFGTDLDKWAAVPELKTQPTVTRPAKAFAKNSAELRNGVVSVPEDGRDIVVAAYVEGRWAFTIVRSGECGSMVGPVVKQCHNETRDDGRWSNMVVSTINTLKPKE